MTNEEASVIIGNIPIEGDDCYTIAEYQEAKAIAIKALEQQSCEYKPFTIGELKNEDMQKLLRAFQSQKVLVAEHDCLPSVTPQQTRWIPVSERLPEKNIEVLITTKWNCITIGEMFTDNDWVIYEGTTNAIIDDIKAWMPLPEPYEAESEGEE